jgi:hypothetical protein
MHLQIEIEQIYFYAVLMVEQSIKGFFESLLRQKFPKIWPYLIHLIDFLCKDR